uniref:Integral membrane protein n=1 Tax=Moniliophthora roreri TaxID=221103 RepID=A0A0W0FQN5_MONRR
MFKDTSPEMAALVGLWLTTLLYGVNIALFIGCLHVLLKRRYVTREAQAFLLATSTLQFILSTVHVVTALIQLIQGFALTANVAGASTLYFLDFGTAVHIVQRGGSLIGDGILIWRVYMVWRKDIKIIILPVRTPSLPSVLRNSSNHIAQILLLTGTTVCVCKAIFNLTTLNPTDILFLPRVIPWLTAIWAMSLAVQGICTLLIASKIWWDSRTSRKAGFGSSRQMSVVWTIVESGAVYSISTVFLMTFFLLKTQVGAIIGDPLGQISAIVPTTIVVRVGLGLNHGSTSHSDSARRFNPAAPPSMGSGGSYSLQESPIKAAHNIGSVPVLDVRSSDSYWKSEMNI